MGVVTWAWPLLQLKFCECQKLLWIRTLLSVILALALVSKVSHVQVAAKRSRVCECLVAVNFGPVSVIVESYSSCH